MDLPLMVRGTAELSARRFYAPVMSIELLAQTRT
jgi:hypothetical protein